MRTGQVCQCEDRDVEAFDAIVLAGGGARRLGGVDKAALVVGTSTLLSHALAAVADAKRVVVVGPAREVERGSDGPRFVVTSEDPPGGGPVAAVAAGLGFTGNELVVVLACDMPFFGPADTARLLSGIGHADAAMLVDGAGRRQFLAAAYRRTRLLSAIDELPQVVGAAMRDLVNRLTVTELLADPETTIDVDTSEDVERTRRILEGR
jgi:molybdopterin-guanine dinucleotide biosynthesis protein A